MYALIAGGGKVGSNILRTLLRSGHEATLVEQRRDRFDRLEEEFEHQVQHGDATEIYVLEHAGIGRPPDLVLALTGDDEDNIVICQIARERYSVPKVIARVNDPRNQAHFDLLGHLARRCRATASIMALIEHEVPEHELVHLLELRKENLEIVEVQIDRSCPVPGKTSRTCTLPDGARLISVMRRRQGGDRGRLHRAAPRRPGAGDARARPGGRAPEGAAPAVIRRLGGVASRSWPRSRRAGAGGSDGGAPVREEPRRPRPPRSACAVVRGLDAPVHVAAPRSEPGRLYVVEQAGRIVVVESGRRARRAVPRHPPARPLGRRAGPAVGRLPSALRAEPPLLRQLHRHRRAHARGRVPLGRDAGAARHARAGCSSCASRTRTTTAASSRSVPTARSTSGRATAAQAATPRTAPRTPVHAPRQADLASTSTGRRGAADRRARAAQPVALLVRPAHGRPLDRRRRPERLGGDRLPAAPAARPRITTAGTCTRGGRRSSPSSARPAHWCTRSRSTRTGRRAMLGHGRLRLPRRAVACAARALLLRRLLQRHRLEPPRGRRTSALGSGASLPRAGSDLLRRGRARRAPTSSRTAAPSGAHSRASLSASGRRGVSRRGGRRTSGPRCPSARVRERA